MNTITIMSNRRTTANIPEVFYIQDNKISSIRIQLPPKIGDYNLNECSIELRACIDDDYISYEIPTDNKFYDWQPTTDITEKSQLVNLVFYITADGGVIGRTKPIQLNIQVNPDKGEELTPREQFDIVIREQRAEIAEQAETINSQASQIEQDTETINGLNTQVSELTTENEQLEVQHTADQNTIQYLIENPPEAHLQPKSVTPTNQMQVVEPDEGYQGLSTVTVGAVTPPRLQTKQVAPSELTTFVTADEGYDGLSSVTVDNVTASIDPNIQPGNIKKDVVVVGVRGTYDPFPYNSVGGIYILAQTDDGAPTKILIKNYNGGNQYFRFYDNGSWLKSNIREVVFENCSDILSLEGSAFSDAYNLNKLELSGIKILSSTMLRNTKITSLIIPSTVDTLLNYCCINNLQLKTLFIPKSVTSMINNCFSGNSALEFVTIENGFNCNNLNLSSSTLYSVETIVSWLEALADRTGETAYTLTMGTTNLNKLTAEQKAIATNKNWNLA